MLTETYDPSAGGSLLKPQPGWPMVVSLLGSLDALTRGLAIDLAPVRVNSVCPGVVDTEVRPRTNRTVCSGERGTDWRPAVE